VAPTLSKADDKEIDLPLSILEGQFNY